MDSSVLVALIMSAASIVCALIAAVASAVLLPSRRLAACEAENSALRAENQKLRLQLSTRGGPDGS